MKCKEELNALKTEVKAMNENLPALTDEDLGQVTGGSLNKQIDSVDLNGAKPTLLTYHNDFSAN